MSGKRYLLDTNAIIQLLSGNRAMCDIVTNDEHFNKQSRVAVKTYSFT